MTIKQNPVYVCDGCEKELGSSAHVETYDVPNEGCSTIRVGTKSFEVGEGHYCSLECFTNRVKKDLKR